MKEMLRKTKARLVIQYFLRRLQQSLQNEKVSAIDNVFLSIYSKDELMDIIKWLYVPTVPQWINYNQMDKEELLQAIGDDFYILSYEIDQARMELYETTKVTPERVRSTLTQLGLETHYLIEKPVMDWDEYDCSNFRALSYKAGNPIPVFGIFDSSVNEEDKYIVTSPPPKLYNTEKEANDALLKMIEKGQLKKGDAKVMML